MRSENKERTRITASLAAARDMGGNIVTTKDVLTFLKYRKKNLQQGIQDINSAVKSGELIPGTIKNIRKPRTP